MSVAELLHAEAESLAPTALRDHQEGLWAAQRARVRAQSAFYRRKLGGRLDGAVSLDDIQDLPLTEKDELRISQEEHGALGEFLACPTDQVIRLHRTSGTTGRALYVGLSRQDTLLTATIGGRSFFAAGLRPTHRVVHCLNYCLWAGGVTDHLSLEQTGAMVVPFGVGQSEALLDLIPSLKINAIHCTPSYPAVLEALLAERQPQTVPRNLGLRLGLFGGEAGLDNIGFRSRIESTWGFEVRNANYGLSEVLSIMGGQCEHGTDLHFHAGELVFVELLDPSTGARLPIAEGATGELICTHLRKEAQPLLRYRTRDIITVTRTGKCACGRTSWKFQVTGRTDDMFNVRGINVFPTAVHRVLTNLPELTSGEFRIVLRGPGPYDRIELTVEAARNLQPGSFESSSRNIAEQLRRTIGASAQVTLLPHGSLPRTEGKTSLLERID